MPLPLRVPPESRSDSEVARKMLPRDSTSAVTALFEEHYASLVRMARLLVDDRETAEDVAMDAFTNLYRHRRVTLAITAWVVAAVAVAMAGGRLGVDKAGGPTAKPDQSLTVARDFVEATGRFGADTATSYLADDAIVRGDLIAAGRTPPRSSA